MSNLEIAAIRRDGGAQMREAIEQDTVTQYAEHIIDGVEFPPLVVFYDGSDYWLADGFHRIAAYEEAGADTVPVDVRSGQLLDAIKFALKANATNGKPRTSGDLARSYQAAVDKGLCDPTSTKDVKDLLGCSKRWARRLTKEARTEQNTKRNQRIQELSEEGLSQREIAEEVGTSQKSVDRVLSESERHSSVLTHPEGGGDEEGEQEGEARRINGCSPRAGAGGGVQFRKGSVFERLSPRRRGRGPYSGATPSSGSTSTVAESG